MNKNNKFYAKQTLKHLNEIYPIFYNKAKTVLKSKNEDDIKSYCQSLLNLYLSSDKLISEETIKNLKEYT